MGIFNACAGWVAWFIVRQDDAGEYIQDIIYEAVPFIPPPVRRFAYL